MKRKNYKDTITKVKDGVPLTNIEIQDRNVFDCSDDGARVVFRRGFTATGFKICTI